MTEQTILGEIDKLKEVIHQDEKAFAERMQPLKDKLSTLNKEYSRLFSPLKPGDEIPYNPGGKHTGIVRIIEAKCTLIPDKWLYDAEILSVGEDASDYDKKYIGRSTTVYLNRDETPKKLN